MARAKRRANKTIRGFAARRGLRDVTKRAASDVARGRKDTGREAALRPSSRKTS